ncbi:MAG TPA: hypothetical protein VK477_12695 [Acidobacteriota bacterium]|nr:hypothetical protein [Acidobacteriota bacterium]
MRRLAAAAALGGAALAFAADDPNAPLANTKAQLQALKRDTAAQKADTPDGPKFNLPSLATPGSELELARPARDDREAKERKRNEQKDWLLEGFDKLDRKARPTAGKRGEEKTNEDEKPLDPNDPDYFLRLYERQRAGRDAKQIDVSGQPLNEPKSDATDPFAPFMKDWLANSPVRDALRDVRTDLRESAAPLPESRAPSHAADSGGGSIARELPQAGPMSNPFVQALGLPAPESGSPMDVRSPVAEASSSPPPAAPVASSNTIYSLPERPKTDLKQALPPPPSEDKKYFPQLKKF